MQLRLTATVIDVPCVSGDWSESSAFTVSSIFGQDEFLNRFKENMESVNILVDMEMPTIPSSV